MNGLPVAYQMRAAIDADAAARVALDDIVWAGDGGGPADVREAGSRSRGAFVVEYDGDIVGACGSRDLLLGLPGPLGGVRAVAVEGLTQVGVHPDHSRRGVLRAMVGSHLEWTRASGRTLAVLKASEPGIYGRFGYGMASVASETSFPAGTKWTAPQGIVDLAEATHTAMVTAGPEHAERLCAVWSACANVHLGLVVRSAEDIARLTRDVPEFRVGMEPRRLMFATRDGVDVGFAWFRRDGAWSAGRPAGTVDVTWFAAGDQGARLALMRRLVDLDLVTSVVNWVAPDDPLVSWLGSPRALGARTTDSVWLRIADLPAAVAERGYAAPCDLRIEVRDHVIPANDCVWRVVADATGIGRAERTDEAPDLTLDIADLGACWLGGQTIGARAAAGFVIEHRPGAVLALDAALRTLTLPAQAADF